MANTYCTATSTGKGFITHRDGQMFNISGHAGDVWAIENNNHGISWINRITGTVKIKADAQAIVDTKMEELQVIYDAESEQYKTDHPRPEKYILP